MQVTTQHTADFGTRRRGTRHWLGLAASVSMLAALLVPVSAANAETPQAVPAPVAAPAAAFGKPTKVNAKALSGSNGLKVTWKAPSGATKPAAYKVLWGTSSKSSKATYARYVTGTSAIVSAAGMKTKTTYYVWVQPWSAAAVTGKATGALSSADKVKTSSYAYSAPAAIYAVNATKTSMEITWRTVTGSPGYVLRAYNYTTKKYSYQIGYDGSAIFTGLTPNTKYKFTVANRLLTTGYEAVPGVRMSGWSKKSATKTTNPTSAWVPQTNGTKVKTPMREAPTDLALTDRDSTSVTLKWTAPEGYDPKTDKFRVYWAEDQEMKDNDGYTKKPLAGTKGRVAGLDSNTNYYVRIRMVRETVVKGATVVTGVSDRTQAIMVKTRSPKGFISGKVSGVSSGVLSDYVAVAYGKTSSGPGDVKGTANVDSKGSYKLELRPGTYYVQLSYVGSGNYTTNWLTTSGAAAYSSRESNPVAVGLDKTLTVKTVKVGEGGIIKGTVTSTSGAKLKWVYVSARTAWGVKQVVAQAMTDKHGAYTLKGLPPGKTVYVRANGSLLGYGAQSTSPQKVPAAGSTRTINLKLAP